MGKDSVTNPVDEVYEVEHICNHRSRRGAYEYEIKWKNYGSHENTWEPAANLPKWMVDDYNRTKNIGNYFATDKKLAKILRLEKKSSGNLIAHVKFHQQDVLEYVPVEWINLNYPMKIIAFYENRSFWKEEKQLVKVHDSNE